jgi:hypothetical protein
MTVLRTLSYVGWLGHGNLGDQALYEVCKRIFSPYQLIPFKSKHVSEITLFGGGTLLPHWTLMVMPNRYNYAYGVGVANPSFWGDFHHDVIKQMKKFGFRYIGVRGYKSKRLLEGWGIDSTVIGDPCLLLEPTHYKKRNGRIVAVNAGGSRGNIWGGNEEKVYVELAKVCKLLREKGYLPVLVSFWQEDMPHIKRISKASDTPILDECADVQKVLDFLVSSHVLIGVKLHSLVFSAACFTPFISIEYRPKCAEFAETMGFENYNIRTDRIESAKIMAMFEDLIDNWNGMQKQLIEKVEMYRKRLRLFADYIKMDIESLKGSKWDLSALEKIRWVKNAYRVKRLRKLFWRQIESPPGKKSSSVKG